MLSQAPTGPLRVVVVWDGDEGDGRGGTAHLVRRAGPAGAEVAVIRPAAAGHPLRKQDL